MHIVFGVILEMRKGFVIALSIAVVLSLSVLGVMLPLVILFRASILSGVLTGILLGGGFVATLILLPIMFFMNFRTISVPESVTITPRDMYLNLLSEGEFVEEEPNGIRFRTTRYTTAKAVMEGDTISIRAGLSPLGACLLYLLWLTGFASIFATILIIMSVWHARRFAASDKSVGLLTAKREWHGETDSIGEKLLTLLRKGEMIVQKAVEARKAVSTDSVILALIVGMIGGTWLLISTYVARGVGEMGAFLYASGLAVLFALAIAIPAIVFHFAYLRPQITELISWKRRIDFAIRREREGAYDAGTADSSLVLLLDMSRRIPIWLRHIRRAGHLRDPGIWILISVLFLVSLGSLSEAFPGIGLIILVAMVALFISWRNRAIREDRKELKEWNSHLDSVQSEIMGAL